MPRIHRLPLWVLPVGWLAGWMTAEVAWGAAAAAEVEPHGIHVYHVAQQVQGASDSNEGSEAHPFKSITRAAELAAAGDTVLVHAGIYRERVAPARGGLPGNPIVYRAAPGETVVVRGSDLWQPQWQAVGESPGVFTAKFPADMPGIQKYHEPGRLVKTARVLTPVRPCPADAPLPFTAGAVFVDTAPYLQVQSFEALARTPGTWLVTPDGQSLQIHFLPGNPPAQRQVELAVRPWIFAPIRRGLGYIQVIGFILEHAADREGPIEAGAAVSARSGNHWLFEANTIRFANGTGLDVGGETWIFEGMGDTLEEDRHLIMADSNVVRRNTLSDNGVRGITAWNGKHIQILGNTVERNGRIEFQQSPGTSADRAGIKVLAMTDGLIQGNLVRNNETFGIWLDNGFKGMRVTGNIVANNQEAGMFCELDDQPALIDNNVIVQNHGEGIYCHDAANVTFAHNMILDNGHFGIWCHLVSSRMVKRQDHTVICHCSDMKILGNIISGNNGGAISLPTDGARSGNNISDYNLFSGPRSQWHGMDEAGFQIGNGKYAATAGADDPANRANVGEADYKTYTISLERWQTLTGRDKHSLLLPTKPHLVATWHSGTVSITLHSPKEQLASVQVPPVEGVERDYFGKLINNKVSFPGPFQSVGQVQPLMLWPLELEGH